MGHNRECPNLKEGFIRIKPLASRLIITVPGSASNLLLYDNPSKVSVFGVGTQAAICRPPSVRVAFGSLLNKRANWYSWCELIECKSWGTWRELYCRYSSCDIRLSISHVRECRWQSLRSHCVSVGCPSKLAINAFLVLLRLIPLQLRAVQRLAPNVSQTHF